MNISKSEDEAWAYVQSDVPRQAEPTDRIKDDVLSVTVEFVSSQEPEYETKPTDKYTKYAGEPPDGGLKAWSVLLGTFVASCATLGFLESWGVFQAYYEEVMLRKNSPSEIAWIGSIQLRTSITTSYPRFKYALVLLPGLVTGRLLDIGYFKIPFLFFTCLLIACIFLIAECKVYWQFVLAQGLGVGLARGMLFGPTLSIISHWFSKRRGLAMGICTFGAAIGGTVFPIAAQNLIPEVGFKWTVRILGFIIILLLGIANVTMDRRLPPANVKGGLFNWAALKNPAYAVYCISGVTTWLGLYTALTYMPLRAVQVGVPDNFKFYLLAIANGTSAFGRIFAGILADRIGPINVMAPFIVVIAAMTFAWPFVTTKGALIAICVIYGFSCGTYVALLPMPAMAMGATDDIGRRTGLFLSFSALGALAGPPISGAIDFATGGFVDVAWYAGGMLLFSACLLVLTRFLHLGKWTGKF